MSGPLPKWLAPLSIPVSWFYGAGVAVRNARFDRRGPTHRLDRPVISIGNITAGGTGKTPMVTWLARVLVNQGVNPAIALRGYGPKHHGVSDEQAEYTLQLPDVPTVADPDRSIALHEYLQSEQGQLVDCVLLDDGFQHRQLHRDLDIVLIDAQGHTMSDRLLPAGFLREPLANLNRADAVVMTRAQAIDHDLAQQVRRHHGSPPMAWTRHRWSALEVYDGGIMPGRKSPDWLQGRHVVTMLGVGHPQSIHKQLQSHGATISADVPVRDHVAYDSRTLQSARRRCAHADGLVVTQKDWVKLADLIDFTDWPVPVIVPQVAIEFVAGEDDLFKMIETTISKSHGTPHPQTISSAERA